MNKKLTVSLQSIALIIYALFALFPLLWIVIISFKPDGQMANTIFVFNPTLDNYKELFANAEFIGYFIDNIIVSFGAIILSVLVGVPAAYALARFDFKGREGLAFTILSFRFAPEILVVLPIFLIYQNIGLYDTYFGLIWVLQVISLPMIIWILRGYFEEIPVEIEHAARLDGYKWWQAFMKITVPLIKPGLVASSLLSFIFCWNNFTFSLLLSDSNVTTTTVAMLRYVASGTAHYGQMGAAAIISALPIIILALSIQKHLVKGLSMGAVKG